MIKILSHTEIKEFKREVCSFLVSDALGKAEYRKV
jgi:hypothetical protein